MSEGATEEEFRVYLEGIGLLQAKGDLAEGKFTGWRRDYTYKWIDKIEQDRADKAQSSARNANRIAAFALVVAIAAIVRSFWPGG